MYVEIRPITAKHDKLMQMLQYTAINMATMLTANGIVLFDDCVKIWIKEYAGREFYPKIEFDIGRQEIQYDMTEDGYIREAHYKQFVGGTGRSRRLDIARNDLYPSLLQIDSMLRSYYNFVDGYTPIL